MQIYIIAVILQTAVLCVCDAQRIAPGVPPQHYQQHQQYQQVPVQQVPQQQVPVQQVPIQQQQQQQQQHQQHHIPVQQVPQVPVQQQQQVPMQQQPPHAHHQGVPQPGQILNTANLAHEKEHIQEHMEVPIDTSKMSEQELQFHYFKMHDADNNNKLDGNELIKSLIHWHEQGKQQGQNQVEEKIFKDDELVNLIDPILNVDDTNRDGYIDYPEFVRAQKKAAAHKSP